MSTKALTKTNSAKFADLITREMNAISGSLSLTPSQKQLAANLFVFADAALNTLEVKRNQKYQPVPIAWGNVDLQKLALDAAHRIDLGLDALIPNHMHVIPYFNKKAGKYAVDLRVGYAGKEYVRLASGLNDPIGVVYELVYSNDKFTVMKKGFKQRIESYEFDITAPFDRGEIIGGFGYIMYENEQLNRLVLVSEKDFLKSKSEAKQQTFWNDRPVEMRMKTLMHRTLDKIPLDPRKIKSSHHHVDMDEKDDAPPIEDPQDVIDIDANTGEVIDIDEKPPVDDDAPPTAEELANLEGKPGKRQASF